MALEIERKWRMSPEVARGFLPIDGAEICQAYVLSADNSVLRMRTSEMAHGTSTGVITVKGPSDVPGAVEEYEMDYVHIGIVKDLMQEHVSRGGKILRKTRRKIRSDGLVVEIDYFHDALEGLVVAEIEFKSSEACASFVPPAWLGVEVTADKRYANVRLIDATEPPK